jgi:hypothetical protein
MKRQWHVRREVMERPDAQRRWDRAYQNLLQWTLATERRAAVLQPKHTEEVYHAASSLHPGLDLSAGSASDH